MNKKKFLEVIGEQIQEGSGASVDIILRQIPDTSDNQEAVKNLSIQEDDNVVGVGSNSGVLASSLINSLEDLPVPAAIKLRYPHLHEKEWASLLRYCTLVLCALEEDKVDH